MKTVHPGLESLILVHSPDIWSVGAFYMQQAQASGTLNSSSERNYPPIIQKGIRMLSYLHKVMRTTKDRGASAVEYGLMVAAIAAVIVGIVFGLGSVVSGVFDKTCGKINTQANGGTGTTCPAATVPTT
jgi:pilus assembly protein Flp/PilA